MLQTMKASESRGNFVIDLWSCLCTLSTNCCSHRVLQWTHLFPAVSLRLQGQPFARRNQGHCAPRAALTGALVYSAMSYSQPRLQVSLLFDLWLISFEKGDRHVHKGLALIFILRPIFATLNKYQEKEASAVNKLWTRNSNTFQIQTVRSGDCKGSVEYKMHRASSVPFLCYQSVSHLSIHLPVGTSCLHNLSVTCFTSLSDFQDYI